MNRKETQKMLCMVCSTVQNVGPCCTFTGCPRYNLHTHYFCNECVFWDDDSRKNIFHCHDCGICRVGQGLGVDYFHCQKCNICLAMSMKGRHKCIERNLESDCPICGEYMFTSTSTVIFMPCGHCIHYKCHQEYIQTSYQCPTCFKSLTDMSEYFQRIDAMLSCHHMPPEYQNTTSLIYCNDCEKKSVTKYHFLYHKCQHCQGYNTKVLQTIDPKMQVDQPTSTLSCTTTSINSSTTTNNNNNANNNNANTSVGLLSILSHQQTNPLLESSTLLNNTTTTSVPSDLGRRDYGHGASGPPHL
jgi:hypothetical protein